MTKADLTRFKRQLLKEQQKRKAQQEGQLRSAWAAEMGGEGEASDDGEEGEEEAGPAAAAPPPQQQQGQQGRAVELHGGHFLRSCGSVEPPEPADRAAAAAAAAQPHPLQQHPLQQAQQQQAQAAEVAASPPKRARHPVEPAIPAHQAQQAQQVQQAFSPLHHEVLRFAQRATPTPQEVAGALGP
jgi:hypothetical protein